MTFALWLNGCNCAVNFISKGRILVILSSIAYKNSGFSKQIVQDSRIIVQLFCQEPPRAILSAVLLKQLWRIFERHTDIPCQRIKTYLSSVSKVSNIGREWMISMERYRIRIGVACANWNKSFISLLKNRSKRPLTPHLSPKSCWKMEKFETCSHLSANIRRWWNYAELYTHADDQTCHNPPISRPLSIQIQEKKKPSCEQSINISHAFHTAPLLSFNKSSIVTFYSTSSTTSFISKFP